MNMKKHITFNLTMNVYWNWNVKNEDGEPFVMVSIDLFDRKPRKPLGKKRVI